MNGHAFSISSSHANFSESEDGYVLEGGEEEPEVGIASSSDSQVDEEEGAQHGYTPEHAQEAVFGHFDPEEDEEEAYREPLGGKFGKINAMTPITERTFAESSVQEDFQPRQVPRVYTIGNGGEEKGGRVGSSLSDSLAVVAAFRPPIPCIPTDPVIVSTLLWLLPADEDFHDLRTKDAGVLDGLQLFAVKRVWGSKGGNVEDGVYGGDTGREEAQSR